VLQMIGWIWLAVALVPLLWSIVAKRKGLDRMFRTSTLVDVDDDDDEDPVVKVFSGGGSLSVQQMQAQSLTSSLEQLANLHKQGVLTDQQFEQAKAQLLAAQPPPATT